jgi:excisionase family DNA binding protein
MNEPTSRRAPLYQRSRLSPITLRIPEACLITGFSRSKLYELIKAGQLDVIKVGSMTLVPMASIEGLLAGNVSRNEAGARPPGTVSYGGLFLAAATISGIIACTPDWLRREFYSTSDAVRKEAEAAISGRLIGALYPQDDIF